MCGAGSVQGIDLAAAEELGLPHVGPLPAGGGWCLPQRRWLSGTQSTTFLKERGDPVRKERVGFAMCAAPSAPKRCWRTGEAGVQLYETVIPIASEALAFTDTPSGPLMSPDGAVGGFDRAWCFL